MNNKTIEIASVLLDNIETVKAALRAQLARLKADKATVDFHKLPLSFIILLNDEIHRIEKILQVL